MRVLVTGGTGLVGRAVGSTKPPGVDAEFVGRAAGDLRDPAVCHRVVSRVRPTHVIHLAARVGGVQENILHAADFFRDNTLINVNVFEAARLANVRKVVSLLSSCVYPDGAALPLRESDLHAGEPHASNFAYAYAKRMLDVLSRAYARQFEMTAVCLIPNNLYGPHDNFDLESGHVIPAMIRKIHAAATQGVPAILWGDGSPLREFTYAPDLGRVLWWAVENYAGLPLNVGTHEEVSIRRVAELICEQLGYDAAKLEWDASRPSGQHRKPTDTTRFATLNAWNLTPLATGLRQTIDWYVSQYPNVRGVTPPNPS